MIVDILFIAMAAISFIFFLMTDLGRAFEVFRQKRRVRKPRVVFRGREGVLFTIPLKNVSDTRMGVLAEEVKALISQSLKKQEEDDIEKLESKGKTYPGGREGGMLHDLLYVFLPILAGTVIVAISIYIAVRQDNPTRLMIPELKMVLMLITGYYLGMGVANIRNRIEGDLA